MTWDKITVQQFQDIYRLSLSTNLEEMDKITRVICILCDKTEKQVDEMGMKDFGELARSCSFLLTDKVPGKPVKRFRAGKGTYAIEYNPAKLRHRQYVEILTFGDKPVENMQLIMASLVQPVKWGVKQKNEADMHHAIADDMLQAPVVHVYHSCVFFCKLFVNSMTAIQDSLVKEMTGKGMTKEEAMQLLTLSKAAMDGFIPQEKSQIMNA